MAIVILAWIYTFYITFSLGIMVERFVLTKKFKLKPNDGLLTIFNGIASLTAFVAFYSFFFKVSLIANVVCCTLVTTYNVANARKIYSDFKTVIQEVISGGIIFKLVKLGTIVCFLLLSLIVPVHADSNFYHLQAIQWAEYFPVIPGLGNFFGRIAFNSHFFLTQAFFSYSPIFKEPLHLLNSFIVLIFALWIIGLVQRADRFQMIYIIVLFLMILQFRGWISSPAPDVVVGVFCWIVSLIFLKNGEENDIQMKKYYVFSMTLCAAVCITFKLSSLFVIFLPLIAYYYNRKIYNRRHTLLLLAISLLVFIPFIARNVILSGYLVYPFPTIDIFNVDWKVPYKDVFLEKVTVWSFNRIDDPDVLKVWKMTFSQWFPIWFENLAVYKKLIFALLVVTPIVLFFYIKGKRVVGQLWACLLVLYAGILFWFENAPDFRFGYGYIIPFLAISFFIILTNTKVFSFILINLNVLLFLFIIFLSLNTFYFLKKDNIDLATTIFFPRPYPKVDTKSQKLGWIFIKYPRKGNCWNEKIPCVNEGLSTEGLNLRGARLEDGFYSKRLSVPPY